MMSGYIRYAVFVVMVLFNMASATVTDMRQILKRSEPGALSMPLLDDLNETNFIKSKEMEWKNEEIELRTGKWEGTRGSQMWCGTINRLPDDTLYQFCSQSKDGGQWKCDEANVGFMNIEVPDSSYVIKGGPLEITLCHEFQFVEGTNVAIFVKVPDGQKWRYLRTENAFVPKLKSFTVDHVSSRRHLLILCCCVSLFAILLCVLGYFLYRGGTAEPNEQSQPNNEDV